MSGTSAISSFSGRVTRSGRSHDSALIGDIQLRIDHITSDMVLKLKALNVLIRQARVGKAPVVWNLNIEVLTGCSSCGMNDSDMVDTS